MPAYLRAVLIDHMRRVTRRHLYSARSWRLEADAPLSYYSPAQCRAYARQDLVLAGAYRRRLLVFMNEPGRFVTRERHDRIMRGEW
jgi:hypothetical protein